MRRLSALAYESKIVVRDTQDRGLFNVPTATKRAWTKISGTLVWGRMPRDRSALLGECMNLLPRLCDLPGRLSQKKLNKLVPSCFRIGEGGASTMHRSDLRVAGGPDIDDLADREAVPEIGHLYNDR